MEASGGCERLVHRLLAERGLKAAVAYRALVAKGKPKKLALIVTMRKLLVTLDAATESNIPWCKQPLSAAA
jgi:hypothetical protein